MRIVWRHDEPVTVRDVCEELRAGRPVAYTTVMTNMKTLESVLNWHYSPTALRSVSTQVTLRFHLPAPNAEYENRGFATKMMLAKELEEEMSAGQR